MSSTSVVRVLLSASCVAALLVTTPAQAAGGSGRSSGVASGDFDGDGKDDLAVGVPGENIGLFIRAGAVHVFYGKSQGLSASRDELWHQEVVGIKGVAKNNDEFGSIVATGDLDGDGFDDLVVGTPRDEDPATGEIAGTVNVIYGSNSGLRAQGSELWHQDSPSIKGRTDDGDQFGAALATADLGKGKADDLVIGAPGDIYTGGPMDIGGAGAVHVLFGSNNGLTAGQNQFWHQNSDGISDFAEANDRFGQSLAIGDFGRSKAQDLAIGAPLEDNSTGQVHVLFGRKEGGLTARDDELLRQGINGVPDTKEQGEYTGWSLVAGQLGRGKQKDLVIAAPFEDSGALFDFSGIVIVVFGSDSGISSQGAERWSRARLDSPVDNDTFGSDLVIADLVGSARNDLVVGSEFATVNGVKAGAVHVTRGTSGGLVERGDRVWTQNSSGVTDTPESGDSFGLSLAVADFGKSGHADLAIGAPSEDFGAESTQGAVHVLYGKRKGLSSNGDQQWTQDNPGVLDEMESGDQFGSYFRSLE